MITIKNKTDKNIDTMKWLGLNPSECLFFDIETTGFSAMNSQLYLIGAVYHDSTGWNSIQWFADTFSSEEEILLEFFNFTKDYRYIISFNGDGFDIPYLTKKALSFGIESTFEALTSIDIFKAVKLFKTLLNLENNKQKSIEKFLGIKREDKYNGGELIEVYQQYLRSKSSELYNLLILHNAEDISGMPDILPIMAYGRLTDTSYCGINVPDAALTELNCDTENEEAVFTIHTDAAFPKPLKLSTRTKYLSLAENTATLRIRMYNGELKHFYPNYRDYYYLPKEDTAIHKSVAGYVDKNFREKAKAANCYTRMNGLFLPQHETIIEPVLCREYRDRETYFPYTEDFAADKDLACRYALHITSALIK